MKNAIYFLALLVGLWQAMAGLPLPMTVASAEVREHLSWHWTEKGHHHGDHGEFDVDDSRESAQHLAFDGVNSLVAEVAFKAVQFPHMKNAEISTPVKSSWATKWSDGVFRPPPQYFLKHSRHLFAWG